MSKSFSPTVRAEFRSAILQDFLEHLDFLKRQVPELISLGIQAQSVGIYTADKVHKLLLYAGPNQTGERLAHVKIHSIDQESLLPTDRKLKAIDFALQQRQKRGHAGDLLTSGYNFAYQQSMPVPLIAPTGSTVSLQTIFSQSFGSSTPGFYSITLSVLPQ